MSAQHGQSEYVAASGAPPDDERRGWIVDAWVVASIVSIPVLVGWVRGLEPMGLDLGEQYLPWWGWWWDAWRWGGGWNPWNFAGHPANADPQIAALHPFGILYALASPSGAARIEAALGPIVAALGMLAYLRRIGCGRLGSLVGALSFGLGGFVATHAAHPTFIRTAMVIPWALYAIEAYEGARLAALLALCIGFGGHPQGVLYGFTWVLAYAIFVGQGLAPKRRWAIAGGFALGAGIASHVWIPMVELAAVSTRAFAEPIFPDPRIGAGDLLRLFVPLAGGGGAGPLSTPPANPFACTNLECGGYPGLVPWLLVLSGLWLARRDRRVRFWIAAAALALVGASGAFESSWMSLGLRAPSRMLLCWNVAIAALAGIATRSALDRESQTRSTRGAAAIGVIAVVIILTGVRIPDSLTAILVATVVLAASGIAFFVLVRTRYRSPAWLVLPLAIDLLVFNASLDPVAISGKDAARLHADIIALEQELEGARASEYDRAIALPRLRGANWASLHHVATAQGYNPLVLQSVAELLGQRGSLGAETIGLIADEGLASPRNHALDLLRVRVVAQDRGRVGTLGHALELASGDEHARWQPSPSRNDSEFISYVNRRTRPVAWLVDRVRVVPPGDALASIRGTRPELGFDPATEALIGAPAPELAGLSATLHDDALRDAPVHVDEYGEDELRLSVSAPREALLVTSELDHPGWSARVDGKPSPVHTVNAGFRSVLVPRGDHEVLFVYQPATARVALGLGAASFVVASTLLAVSCRRRGPRSAR